MCLRVVTLYPIWMAVIWRFVSTFAAASSVSIVSKTLRRQPPCSHNVLYLYIRTSLIIPTPEWLLVNIQCTRLAPFVETPISSHIPDVNVWPCTKTMISPVLFESVKYIFMPSVLKNSATTFLENVKTNKQCNHSHQDYWQLGMVDCPPWNSLAFVIFAFLFCLQC